MNYTDTRGLITYILENRHSMQYTPNTQVETDIGSIELMVILNMHSLIRFDFMISEYMPGQSPYMALGVFVSSIQYSL